MINFYNNILLNKTNNERIRREFSRKTEGIVNECIGAVDGWLVKILLPTMKRILWRHIGEVGSSHDSQVFHNSRLGRHLQQERDFLSREGLYIIGDSTYTLRNYLFCPNDNAAPKLSEDTFNTFSWVPISRSNAVLERLTRGGVSCGHH